MQRAPIETGTWRWERGLASWTLCDPRSASELILPSIDSLESFATISKADWTTAADGEEALVQAFPSPPAADEIALVYDQLSGITAVDLELDLVCLRADGSTATVFDGALLWLERDGDETRITFSLNVDLFAARTWGKDRDNRTLAAINGPRLNAFLERLRRSTGARLCDLDISDDEVEFIANGVVLHDERLA